MSESVFINGKHLMKAFQYANQTKTNNKQLSRGVRYVARIIPDTLPTV